MNVIEDIFQIRSCTEILVNGIKINTTDVVQFINRFGTYSLA